MGRVNAETIEKLNDFINSLPEEAKGKCAICNKTLVHIVKQAEAQTGAGTATVTMILAEKINENALPEDKVTPKALSNKVRRGYYINNAYIYIATTPIYPNYFKLGLTTIPIKERLRTLQGIFIEPFTLVGMWEFPSEDISLVEGELFSWFEEHRVVENKEWFYAYFLKDACEFIDDYRLITFPEVA